MFQSPQQEAGLLRAAVIGQGAFGRHHASKYSKLPGVQLTAIADPSADARRASEAAHGITAVADWRDLLGKVDIVSVCSPAITHAPIVRGFLESGAHVLVEKPIATDLKEADALIALAEIKNRVLTVGHQERYVFARTGLLDFEEAPLEVECWRTGPWTGRGADVSAVLDLMIHDLDLVHRMIPGGVADVHAKGRATHGGHSDEISAQVHFDNHAQAKFVASRISPIRRRGMRAVYESGVVEIDFVTREVKNTTGHKLNPLEQMDPLGESVAAFVDAVRLGKPALVRPEEARRALETALLIDQATAPQYGAQQQQLYA